MGDGQGLNERHEKVGEHSEASEGDRRILAELVALGSDLSKERHSIHYFAFGDQDDALAAGRELRKMGFRVEFGRELKARPESRRWPVLADRTEVIDEEVIGALRVSLTRLAKRFGGEYDGWEAQAG